MIIYNKDFVTGYMVGLAWSLDVLERKLDEMYIELRDPQSIKNIEERKEAGHFNTIIEDYYGDD